MKDFPFIWLLFNTKTGKVILCVFIGYIIVRLVGMVSFNNRTYEHHYYPSQYEPINTETDIEDDTYVPDSVEIDETDEPKPAKSTSSSRNTYKEPDNMRGFDPASEDDMDDNGMTRYMEANDDEGWD